MKKIFSVLRTLFIVLLIFLAGCKSNIIIDPIDYSLSLRGEKSISGSETFIVNAEFSDFKAGAAGRGLIYFFIMRDGRMVSLEGKSDFDISYTHSDDGRISVFLDGKLYLQGVFNEDESELSVTFTGSVQPVWDEYARELGWGNELVLKRH